ncbi:MAG: hypothetical protein LBC75_03035 [Fibromonadaceae bacterium]|jgi:hypothetical protein|nr:hypothetical protein [Fibromonadaceae bacterium]
MRLIFLIIAFFVGFAQASKDVAADTSSANKAVFADINIFSQMPLGSVYILWSNLEIEADIKRQITSRNFVLEPYFMQNIDREQFEENQILHLFEEQKKVFFKLFPEEDDE